MHKQNGGHCSGISTYNLYKTVFTFKVLKWPLVCPFGAHLGTVVGYCGDAFCNHCAALLLNFKTCNVTLPYNRVDVCKYNTEFTVNSISYEGCSKRIAYCPLSRDPRIPV
jgi:hypothetical protein